MNNRIRKIARLSFSIISTLFLLSVVEGISLLLPHKNVDVVHAEEFNSDLLAPSFGQLSAMKFQKTLTYEMGGMALDTSGKVWSWGYNLYGTSGVREYGDGTPLSYKGPTNGYLGGMRRIEYFTEQDITVVDITSGYRAHLALDDEGKVYAWGNGSAGEMGNGKNTADNPTPTQVLGLPYITKIFSSNNASNASNFAVDVEGKLWAWGHGSYGKLGIGSRNQNKPVQVTIPNLTASIVSIASGLNHTQLLDSEGEVWYTGSATGGVLGNGTTAGNVTEFTKMVRPEGMSKVIDIAVGANSIVALDDNHTVWQWGNFNGKGLEYINRPRIVTIDMDDKDANFSKQYQPIPQKVFSGHLIHYFVDQYGRPWSWGSGTTFGFGTDMGYEDSNDLKKTSAVQLPNIMGDGDTQIWTKNEKLPRYLTTPDPKNKKGRLPYLSYGVYSFNGQHPTIYDHKYMMRDSDGNYLDDSGNKYRYQSSDDTPNKLYEGFFYKLDSQGKVTTDTGVPSIKPDERTWISLAGKPVPQIEYISASFESFVMTDVDGNIYKWGTTGSGTMAWGWDVEEEFDEDPPAFNKRAGLYNRYTYEIMYMRGAPMLPQPTITFKSDMEKTYYKRDEQKEESLVSGAIKIPPTMVKNQLGLTISSQLHEFVAVIIPYDVTDDNVKKSTPSHEDVVEAMGNPKYKVIDLMEKEGVSKPQTNHSEVDWKEIDASISVTENSVVWLVVDYTAYDHDNHLITTSVKKYDNYYQEMELKHEGIHDSAKKETIYKENYDNVTKLTKDDIPDKVGFPLDVNHQIIGDIVDQPTFGYDEVQVSKLSKEQLEAIETNLSKYWLFKLPQSDTKTYELNGIDKDNNDDRTKSKGELKVREDYTHSFYYEKNPKGFANLHFVGVDEEGNKVTEFNMPDREVKKGVDLSYSPQDLSEWELLAEGFYVLDGLPPLNYPVDVTSIKPLNKEGNIYLSIPFDDIDNMIKTVVIMYKPPVKFGDLHVRQVVLNKQSKLPLPDYGYLSLKTAKVKQPIWEYGPSTQHVLGLSQSEHDSPEYLFYSLSLANSDYKGYGVNYIVPQYHEYVGYKLDDTTGEYDNLGIKKDKSINIDYTSNKEYWLTVYIQPTTKNPGNYSWETRTNDFGAVKK